MISGEMLTYIDSGIDHMTDSIYPFVLASGRKVSREYFRAVLHRNFLLLLHQNDDFLARIDPGSSGCHGREDLERLLGVYSREVIGQLTEDSSSA